MLRILCVGNFLNKQILFGGLVSILSFGVAIADDGSASIQDVLNKEAQGLRVDRVSELKPLLDAEKNDHARWHSGEVMVNGTWSPIDEVSEMKSPSNLTEYLKLRGDGQLSVDGHRKLAKWCQDNGLSDQGTAHWHGVLESATNDVDARKALGFERIGSNWFSKEDLARADRLGSDRVQNFKKWMPKMQQFAIAICGTDTRKKSKAIAEVKSMDDPSAIQALYMTAIQLQGDYARPFVDAIKKQRSAEACLALAKIAVASPGSIAAQSAMDGMKEYRHEFYVPELLSLMEDGLELRQDIVTRPNGELVLEQAMLRERSDLKSLQVIERIITLDNSKLPIGTRTVIQKDNRVVRFQLISSPEDETSKNIATRDAQRQAEKTADDVRQQNLRLKETRENVVEVLKGTTGANPGNSAQEWWNWWDRECEDNRIYSKAYVEGYAVSYESLNYSRQNSAASPVLRHECLVAGTTVQTINGLRAVELIKTGDMVLSSDVESGKIEFKPVVRTTVRPPADTMKIVTDGDSIQATLGHYWWVSGHGWLRTKEIVKGMRLHTATGNCLVESVEPVAEKVTTYNLIVHDNHSYFVGAQRVLSSDASELKPSLLKVPGLSIHQETMKLASTKR